MSEKFFALGLAEHRLWGLVLQPMMLLREEGKPYYKPDHIIFPSETDINFTGLSNTEKSIVRIIDEYNEHTLFRLFSKHRNVKEFQENVKPESIANFVRPYIEKRVDAVFQILRGTRIKLFMREKSRSSIFEEDFLSIEAKEVQPVFNFHKSEAESSYNLELHLEGKPLNLKGKYFDLITNDPAIFRLSNKVFIAPGIEAKKIKPFFSKEKILIPENTVVQYFKTFAKNIIRDYEVNATGFEIRHTDPERKVLLHLEKGIRNQAVLILEFAYGKRKFYPSYDQHVFVDFHQGKGDFYYEKYRRDPEWEQSFHDLLSDLGLASFDQVNYELKGNRDLPITEQLYELVNWLNKNAAELAENQIVIHRRQEDLRLFIGTTELTINSRLKEDWFDIFAEVVCGEYRFPLIKLRKHILELTREYVLPDGSIFIIPMEWFGRFKELFEFGKADKDIIRVHKQHFFIIEKSEKATSARYYKELEKLNKPSDLAPALLPASLNAVLRPYQVEGFTWLLYLQQNNLGGCLADDMGLGKTLQTLSLLLKNKEEYKGKASLSSNVGGQLDLFAVQEDTLTSLVVVPASLVHNWINEIRRFAPSLKVHAHIGNQRAKNMGSWSRYDVIISSYHTVRQDIEFISSFPFHYVILDESQVIKNPSSKLYRAMLLLNSKYRMVMTGTPIENSLIDLWAQLNFINNGLLGSLNFFRREYVLPVERKNDSGREEKLKKLINPFILRRTKEEVARDLPEMTEQVIVCSMTEEQRKFYEEEKSTVRRSIFERLENEGIEKTAMIVLQGLTRLRQISNHPVLVDENYRDESGKFNEILRNLESVVAEGHKALVFSSFVMHLELLKAELEAMDLGYTLLTGASTNREALIQAFRDNPECKIFLISLKAGGLGLNLTEADYVFILDPWWNPKAEEQAISRSHRIGQEKNVFVYRFISENSIEEKIQHLQDRKSQLADAFVTSNNPMKNISKKELEELFG